MLVGERGFEPPTHWSQTSCATKLRYSPKTKRILLPEPQTVNTFFKISDCLMINHPTWLLWPILLEQGNIGHTQEQVTQFT